MHNNDNVHDKLDATYVCAMAITHRNACIVHLHALGYMYCVTFIQKSL